MSEYDNARIRMRYIKFFAIASIVYLAAGAYLWSQTKYDTYTGLTYRPYEGIGIILVTIGVAGIVILLWELRIYHKETGREREFTETHGNTDS
jgi:formate hydrogenlyase subunit 3/multisubunit Na+/H+ antiporter MnhD subunit